MSRGRLPNPEGPESESEHASRDLSRAVASDGRASGPPRLLGKHELWRAMLEHPRGTARRVPPHTSASSRGLLLTPLLAWPLGAALDTTMHTHTHTHTHHPARAQALASKADKRDLETAVEELQAALLRV